MTNGIVMAGLVPAIHVLLAAIMKKDVDARDKRGHDERRVRAHSLLRLALREIHDQARQQIEPRLDR
jgi:hypothetical protein